MPADQLPKIGACG